MDKVRKLVNERPWGEVLRGADAEAAIEVAPGIHMSAGTSNAYMLATDEGRVIINTGLGFEALTHKRNFDAVNAGPTTHILVTQGHVDHLGGVELFREAGTLFIAHEANTACQADDARISERRQAQSYVWFAGVIEQALKVAEAHPDVVVQSAPSPDLTFAERKVVKTGGRELILLSTPGGETVDSCVVWLAREGILFTGNLFGPLFPHFPNFNTLRGDKYRFADAYLESLAFVRELAPKLLITGHGMPIKGKKLIRRCLDRLEEAVRYVHDETLRGINEGRDIDEIAASIRLPDALYVGQGYGRVEWAARTFWESYLGWFKLRSTTELYPGASAEAELARLAGRSRIIDRGRELLGGDPLRSLALAEAALKISPGDREATRLSLDAHRALLRNEEDARNFWLGGWLRSRLESLEEELTLDPADAPRPGDVRALMESMPSRFVPSAAPGLSAVYQYELTGSEGGVWAVVVESDACRVQEGAHPSPDCRIGMKDLDFLALNYGELHPLRAAMKGKLSFEGDKKKAVHLDKLFQKTARPGEARAVRDEIDIDDLASPILTPTQRTIKALASRQRTPLASDEVLRRAERRTGLSDFGSRDFEERLELLVEDYRSDTGLSELGRQVVFGDLVRYASNRLLIQDTLGRHPEILEERIERPLIVAGLPRSGTTHLVNLLAADSRFRSLPLWEAQEPLPNPREGEPGATRSALFGALGRALPERARDWLGVESLSADPRYLRSAGKWAGIRTMVPFVAAMHPMNPDHVHEELELMAPDFASYTFEWTGHVPRFRDHYLATDQAPHYAYMKRALQLLQWRDQGPAKTWVLKCPQHLEQLPALLATFPDATVVFTHRDPVAVLRSTVTMLAYGQRMSRETIDLPGLLEYWAARVEHLLRKGVADRGLVPEDGSLDVLFHEYMADTEGLLDEVYRVADLERTPRAREEQRAFLDAHPRGKEGRVRYDLEGQFGVSPETLRDRYRFYFERFGVRAE